jgi:hypothetical protein
MIVFSKYTCKSGGKKPSKTTSSYKTTKSGSKYKKMTPSKSRKR